eukprot:scaffold32868_cov57-Phaeocystis_antarctica.AAC.2
MELVACIRTDAIAFIRSAPVLPAPAAQQGRRVAPTPVALEKLCPCMARANPSPNSNPNPNPNLNPNPDPSPSPDPNPNPNLDLNQARAEPPPLGETAPLGPHAPPGWRSRVQAVVVFELRGRVSVRGGAEPKTRAARGMTLGGSARCGLLRTGALPESSTSRVASLASFALRVNATSRGGAAGAEAEAHAGLRPAYDVA